MNELELPYPPSVNHYYRHVGPRTLISREGRRYRERVTADLKALGIESFSGALILRVEVYPPDRRRRDIDNVQKALLDALQHGGAYQDDSQIAKLIVERHEPVSGGRVIVRIRKRPRYETVTCRKCGRPFEMRSDLAGKLIGVNSPNCPRCPICEGRAKGQAKRAVAAYERYGQLQKECRQRDEMLRMSSNR